MPFVNLITIGRRLRRRSGVIVMIAAFVFVLVVVVINSYIRKTDQDITNRSTSKHDKCLESRQNSVKD